jgi:phosphatidylglycerophosphate synthase
MNSNSDSNPTLLTAANLLTSFRFVSAPILLWLAWHGFGLTFLLLLGVALLTDALDGIVARWKGQVTPFGAKLDSWADMVNYCTIALGSWWLWPEVVIREAVFVSIIIGSYLFPPLVGILKFGSFTSYHTWMVKLAAASVGLSLFVLFLGGPAWPFRIAAFVCIIAAVEEISISLVAPELYSNVNSIWDLKQRLSEPKNTDCSENDAGL